MVITDMHTGHYKFTNSPISESGDPFSESWWVSNAVWLLESEQYEIQKQWCVEQFGIDKSRWTADNCVFFFMQYDDF
jgi:hypothetical protein